MTDQQCESCGSTNPQDFEVMGNAFCVSCHEENVEQAREHDAPDPEPEDDDRGFDEADKASGLDWDF